MKKYKYYYVLYHNQQNEVRIKTIDTIENFINEKMEEGIKDFRIKASNDELYTKPYKVGNLAIMTSGPTEESFNNVQGEEIPIETILGNKPQVGENDDKQ